MAEDAAQARAAFIAKMSHEIRTPMNAIMGLSEAELRNDLPDETHDNVEKIYNSGATLLSIINDILDISKIDSGNFDIVPAEYDFANLISDTIHQNVVRIAGKPIKFEPSVDDTVPCKLFGDEVRLKQIMNNLLSNAFKYTKEGSVWMTVAGARHGSEIQLTLSVKDTGIGIKPEDLGSVFGEYTQFDKLANRKIEGTGLGLAICKKLVDLMGGTIEVKSEYGRGSVFTVTLRQGIIDETPIGAETAQGLRTFRLQENRHARTLADAPMPYGKVLVVDDVVTNLEVARALMRPYGLTVHCLDGGRQAVETVRRGKIEYDVIFMDHMMPGVDGLEAVRMIRGIGTDYAANVPIIALTANALVGNEDMFLKNGFQGFVSKPIDVLKLDAILNKWIRDPHDKTAGETRTYEEFVAPRPDTAAELSIEGVDVEEGAARMGSVKIYMDILETYVKQTSRILDEIRTVDANTLGDYAISVHGVKGASRGISANALGASAEFLERAAKSGDFETVAANNDNFVAEARKLIDNISAALAERRRGEPPKEAADEPDRGALRRLLEASKNFDSDAMRDVIAQLNKYSYANHGELVQWLTEQTDNLEYGAVADRLENSEAWIYRDK
jgi:CheY-like chemotaxis protein/two-component sensor histidine kinase